MLRCDKRVYKQCPDKEYCGSLDNAVFVEGSECDKYNREVIRVIEKNTADVVDVVMCQNCARAVVLQHSDNVMCRGEKMPKDGFCSRGVRRGLK